MRRPAVTGTIFTAVLLALSSLAPGGNHPPNACFSWSPPQGTIQTSFAVDAGCSSDDHTPVSNLKVRWDWDYASGWDTAPSTIKTASHTYATEGNHAIGLLVQDQQGLTGTKTHTVLVVPQLAETPFGPQAREPDIDVNPLNASHLVVTSMNGPSGALGMIPYPVFYSTNAGQTWTQATGIGPNDEVADPSIEYDADGRVFYMELVPDPANAGQTPIGVLVARSLDDGVTFPTRTYPFDTSSTFTLPGGGTTHSCASSGTPYDFPKLGVDRSNALTRNNLYATARAQLDQDGNGTCDSYGIVFARSTDHGATWTSYQVLDVDVNRIAVTANGTVLLAKGAMADARCAAGSGIVLRKSTDGGVTFTPGTCIYNSNGDLFPGSVWTTTHASDANLVWLAFDGRLNSVASSHIFVMKSTDGGDTWSSPLRVDDAIPDDHVDHSNPTLALSPSGRLDMSWFDWRNASTTVLDGTNWQPTDVYHSFSVDGGVTWTGTIWGTSNIRVTPVTGTTFHGGGNDYLTTISSGSQTWVAYAQDRDGSHYINGFIATLTYHP